MVPIAKPKGFTLIEMIIAVAIFALVGLGSVNVLSSITRSNETSLIHSERLQMLQLAILTIERDFRQATRRSVRVNGEAPQDSFISHGELEFDSQSQFIAMRKVGWINPMNLMNRSEIQSFAYRVVDDKLERVFFEYPDPAVGEEFKSRVLLDNVTDLTLEFHDGKSNEWKEKWASKDFPAGISITLTLGDMGDIQRIILLPEAMH